MNLTLRRLHFYNYFLTARRIYNFTPGKVEQGLYLKIPFLVCVISKNSIYTLSPLRNVWAAPICYIPSFYLNSGRGPVVLI